MKRSIHTCLGFLIMVVFVFAAQAQAAAKSTFVVLPFAVEGPSGFTYLEQSVPQMFVSRLYWKDNVESVSYGNKKPVADAAVAESARKAANADYVVWGRVTVVGQDCSLDVNVQHKTGKKWHYVNDAKANQFMTAIKQASDSINKEVFNRTSAVAAAPAAAKSKGGRVNQMNPNLVINETTPKDVYLNPHFRYAGGGNSGDDSSLRSQALPFVAVGMEICDADNDGKNEIFILEDFNLHAFHFENGKLEPRGKFSLPRTLDPFMLRSYASGGGKVNLVLNAIDPDKRPSSMLLSYSNGNFTVEARDIKYFLNVVKLPPSYQPVLIGQQAQPPKLFRPGVYEMTKSGKGLVQGNRLNLPEAANAMNFTYMPGGFDDVGGDKLMVLSNKEHITVYTSKGSRIAETEETYSGSSKGFEVDNRMPGLGEEKVTIKDQYYVPIRMLAVNFDHDDRYELVVNRPLSTASKLFDRYRFFPQSEVHSLYWDGVGLNLQWKTRRVKGSITDIALADANNDGIQDLVTLVNTHPGAIGAKARKTLVQIYPLDLESSDPNTPAHQTFLEQE